MVLVWPMCTTSSRDVLLVPARWPGVESWREGHAMDRDTLRAEFATGLSTEAARRFGAERAAALRQTIGDVAGWMADVAAFPLDPEEPPAFYAEPAL